MTRHTRCSTPSRPSSGLSLFVVLLLFAVSAGVATAQRTPQRSEQVFSEAYKLYSNQLYEQAIEGFASFREAYPDHINAAEALYYQAESSLAVGHTDQAVALFTQFRQRYPAHPLAFRASLALGQYFYETRDFQRAIATLTDVLDDDPPDEIGAKALYWMGESSQNLGRTNDALRYFRQAADTYRFTETAPIALYAIAYTHVQQENYDEAARAFELLGARYPDSPYAQNLGLALAEVYYELEDYQRVVSEIKQRMPQLDPAAKERATFLIAEAYNQLRDSENAIVYYRQITEGDLQSPYYRRALYGLGWNYYHEGVHQWAADHFAQARGAFDDALAMQATYYEAVNRVLADEKRAAIDLFKAVADTWPDGSLADHALYELGLVQYDLRLWS
ncbi:MAG: tetratricopeptide repeat protein, partial [Rhodothermales bacterium]